MNALQPDIDFFFFFLFLFLFSFFFFFFFFFFSSFIFFPLSVVTHDKDWDQTMPWIEALQGRAGFTGSERPKGATSCMCGGQYRNDG